MTVRIATSVLEAIVREANASAKEICGLLLGTAKLIEASQSCRNVAEDPYRGFEIDPEQLFRAHRAERAGGPRIVGYYHSHPQGPPLPSARDAASAAPDGMLWLIATGRGTELFRAIANGPLHGRFEAIALTAV